TPSHGARCTYLWAAPFNMPPQEGTSGGTPIPRKLRVASATIAVPRKTVTRTMYRAKQLGIIWRKMMRPWPAPMALGGRMESISLTVRAWERRTRAVLGMKAMLRAMTTLLRDAPKAAMIAIARIRAGKAIMVSIILWMMRSVLPPKWTLVTPTTMPMVAPIKALRSPAYSDTLAPYTSRLNTSRPTWSPPSHSSDPGGA